MTDFTGKVVLVTGASRGIGRAIAESFCKNGAAVFVTAKTNINKLEELVNNYSDVKIYPYKLDFDCPEEIEPFFKYISNREGKLDILVYNVGLTVDKLILRFSVEDFERVMKVNLEGAFLCAKYAAELMIKKRWGRIIFIGSVSGFIGNVGQSAYSAAKSAFTGLTKTLAKELGSRGITVNTIAPGFVETEMLSALSHNYLQKVKEVIPLQRFAKSQEIAEAVLFLSSDKASFFTGQTLIVDGGLSLVSL